MPAYKSTKFYLAGVGPWYRAFGTLEFARFLVSYYYISSADTLNSVKYAQMRGWDIFLDSGAFSAMSLGKSISNNNYIDYCLANKDTFTTIAYLDCIGDWKRSLVNYRESKQAGVDGVPTYHIGEPFEYFRDLCDEWNYVAIGGLVPYLKAYSNHEYKLELMRSLIQMHKVAKEKQVKLHGFGLTTWSLIKKLPWYSIDSTRRLSGNRFCRAMTFCNNKMGSVGLRDGRAKTKNVAKTAILLGENYSAEDITPTRKATSESYYALLLHNIKTMYLAIEN